MQMTNSRWRAFIAGLLVLAGGPLFAQGPETTDLTGQQVSVDDLVTALDIPLRGVAAKCAPIQKEMQALTRGVGSMPKSAQEVPAIAPMKVASISATFELDSDELTAGDKSLLATVARALNTPELSAQCFQLAGNTCDLGDASYNMDLSRRRAHAVKSYLVELGVAPDRLVTTGYGELDPLVPNSDEDARRKNRRVDFGALAPAALEYQ